MSGCWLIKRNGSAGPRQLALVFASLVAVAITVGMAFAAQGPWRVVRFVSLGIAAVAAAFLACGRHAADFERIDLRVGRLLVEKHAESRRMVSVFDLPWMQVAMEELGVDLGTGVGVERVLPRQRVGIGQRVVGRRAAPVREIGAALGRAAPRGM